LPVAREPRPEPVPSLAPLVGAAAIAPQAPGRAAPATSSEPSAVAAVPDPRVAAKSVETAAAAATPSGSASGAPARGAARGAKRAWPTAPETTEIAEPPGSTADPAPVQSPPPPSSPEDTDPLAKLKPK